MHKLDFPAFQSDLARGGLNLCQLFALADLAESMPDLQFATDFSHLLLIGNSGADLWTAMPAEYLGRADPIDEYSIDCVERACAKALSLGEWQILFPQLPVGGGSAGLPVPLQKLGTLAGWHHPSPLGIGINATHGLWFAYRGVVLIQAEVSGTQQSLAADQIKLTAQSPCLSCETTPCLSHCPAEALALDKNPDLQSCVSYRVGEASDCASTCLARLACPVGSAFKYTDEQTAYFYNRSLAAAVRWVDKSD